MAPGDNSADQPQTTIGVRDRVAPVYLARHVGLKLVQHLPALLDAPLVYRPFGPPPRGTLAVLGWGLKGKFAEAAKFARRHGLPYIAVEDGFLRSVGLGDTDPALALSFDDLGVYYDSRSPSRLELHIATAHDAVQVQRARALAATWRAAGLSKYNHAPEHPPPLQGPYVLAVDQTWGDMSISLGDAGPPSFKRMLEAALDEHPSLPVVLKVHPDVIAGRKRAHFDRLGAAASARVHLLASNAHAPPLLAAAEAVYVVTSQMGFEALVWNRPVRCFGMPFYGGWGLTADERPRPERRSAAPTLDDLVHAALIDYPRYLDPETGRRCEVERLVDWLALQRRQRARRPTTVQLVAFSDWKKPIARAYFAGSELEFVDAPQPRPGLAARAVWGRPAADSDIAGASDAPLLRVEDGFLRSVGLGAAWTWPLSWVIDSTGMYYDASAPSDLETLLQSHEFDDAMLARARALRQAIVVAGVTKYNVGRGDWSRPARAAEVILVPGQVESDRSVLYGSPQIRRNLDLLRAVRTGWPAAHVVYKPHPDVLAAHRAAGDDLEQAHRWCDEVVTDVPIDRLLAAVDAVHTMTSLAGFEALLRGRRVHCHGMPFYAGWGLTSDALTCARRTRRLSLDELAAGALILYPTYVSRVSAAFCTPERALQELIRWQTLQQTPAEPRWVRWARRLKRWREQQR